MRRDLSGAESHYSMLKDLDSVVSKLNDVFEFVFVFVFIVAVITLLVFMSTSAEGVLTFAGSGAFLAVLSYSSGIPAVGYLCVRKASI
jgi:hypothetical protein